MKNEIKICPRCKIKFKCNVNLITQCQCSTLELSNSEKEFIIEFFNDCLCTTCIKQLKEEYSKIKK